jgi:hypothetical protein
MRTYLAVVALVAACDGPTKLFEQPDAGAIDNDAEVMPDGPPSVDGVWRDTYYTTSGPVTATSSCSSAPMAVKIDQSNASVTMYNGTCKPDGTFRIEAPGNLGTYYLKVAGVLYETNKRNGIDLSTDKLGRGDVAAITGVALDLDMTNAQSWTAGDVLVMFGANIGYRQNLVLTSGTPSPGATAVDAAATWNGYKIDATKSDALQLYQLGKHTSAGAAYDYASLDRVFTAPTLTMENNTPVALTGAFTTGTAGSVALAVDASSFNQFGNAAGPSVSQKTISGFAYATPSTDTIDSPPLISFAQNSVGLTTMSFGTLAYTDPFPSTWARMVKISVGFTVPYSLNGTNGTFNANVTKVVTKQAAETGAIIAAMGPPTQVQLDGVNALTATSITTVPMVTWSAPSVGNASDYEVQIYEVKTNGSSLTFTSVLRVVTKQTSVRIPQGYLLGQRSYIVAVRSRNRQGIDVYATPLRNGASYSTAETLSALVATP